MGVFFRRTRRDWVLTYSGVQYWPAAPRAADVKIIDIAHALSMLCRFTGHTREFYSVAEHSILVSQVVPGEHALEGLLHDATEAYLSDVSRPLKRWLGCYRRLERRNWVAIADCFGLPKVLPAIVHHADVLLCLAEQQRLMPPLPAPQGIAAHTEAGREAIAEIAARIAPMSPAAAEAAFLRRFWHLTRGCSSETAPASRWARAADVVLGPHTALS